MANGNNRNASPNIQDLYGQLIQDIGKRQQTTASQYADMRQNIADTEQQGIDSTRAGYEAARQFISGQRSPYQSPAPATAPSTMALLDLGADDKTMANLRQESATRSANRALANQNMIEMLARSDEANRQSRLADIEQAEVGSLNQLAAIANAQRFGLGREETGAMSDLEDDLASTRLQEIGSLNNQRTFDQNAVTNAVNIFNNMISPIAPDLEPESVIDLWLEFAQQLGMPMGSAVGALGV